MTARPTWRCESCGKIAFAIERPRAHRRHGEPCGPFAPATVAPEGAVFAPEGAVIAPAGADVIPARAADVRDPLLRYRVTTLRQFATGCPRSTVLASHHTTGSIGTAGHRGSALHAAIAEILRTLWRAGESQFERTEEAVAVLREVVAAGPWVITAADMLGVRNLDGSTAESGLVQMISSFAQTPWKPSRFMVIEGALPPFSGEARMTMEIVCPDGEVRTLSGAPDLVIADPPSSAIIVDHKQSMARPTQPREPVPDGQPIRGVQYLTDPQGDYFQLCAYGALAMSAFPSIKTVTLREMSWRWMGPPREATITREVVEEHVIPYLGTVMMQLDQALREGDGSTFAQPRSGKQCASRCSVKHSCPIAAEERGLGVIDGESAADDMGRRWRVLKALEPEMRKALKHWHEATGHCPDAGSGEQVRWDGDVGSRKFGFHKPRVEAPPAPADLAAEEQSYDAFVASMEAMVQAENAKAGVA
jgi:hypothetical protein